VGNRQTVRVLFKLEAHSAAFAAEFGGSLISAGADAVIA
jgi:hypothetical protein